MPGKKTPPRETDRRVELTRLVETEQNRDHKAELLVELARLLEATSPDDARRRAEQALELSRATGNMQTYARALATIAVTHWLQKNFAAIVPPAQEALETAVRIRDPLAELRSANLLGLTAWQTGDRNRAIPYFEQSIAAARTLNDNSMLAPLCNNLGLLLNECGQLTKALDLHFEALRCYELLNDRRYVGITHLNLGAAYGNLGDWEKSVEYFYRALVENERQENKLGMASCYYDVAETYLKRGKCTRAIEYAETAVQLADEAQSPFHKLLALGLIADACLLAGDFLRARGIFDDNLRAAQELGLPGIQVESLRGKAELLLATNEPEAALRLLDPALPMIESVGSVLARGAVLRVLGVACARTADLARAEKCFASAVSILKESGKSYELARVYADYGRFLVEHHPETTWSAPSPLGAPPPIDRPPEFGEPEKSGDSGGAEGVTPEQGDSPPGGLCQGSLPVPVSPLEPPMPDDAKQRGLALVQEAARIFKRLEIIVESEAAERYLFQMDAEHDRRMPLLKSLVSLSTHSLPLSEFAPRVLRVLSESLAFPQASFVLDAARRFTYGAVLQEAELATCLSGALLVTDQAICVPLRLSGRNAGGIYLKSQSRVPPVLQSSISNLQSSIFNLQSSIPPFPGPGPLTTDPAFLEIVADHLSVAIERNLMQYNLMPGAPASVSDAQHPVTSRYPGFVGTSPALQGTYDTIEQVAPTNACILIQGESGTGKELIARIIVQRSPRSAEPFVAVNCAALPEALLESELFGIEKGVATGVAERAGKFEQAHRGTLFLDEVGDMTPALQAKLLRVLQNQEFERVGGRRTIRVDARVIAATNKDLTRMIAAGAFREDLYYRLNVVSLTLPPLRERKEDIPLLVSRFLEKCNEEFQRRVKSVSPEVSGVFAAYPWPGNVRELQNVVERAVILCRTDRIQVSDLPPGLQQLGKDSTGAAATASARLTREESRVALEQSQVTAALRENQGNIAKAARQFGTSRSQFYRLLRRYNLDSKAN